jgi:3-methyladenine DNA glycosylase AlkD
MDRQSLYHSEITEILVHLGSFHGDVPTHRRESRHIYSFSHKPFGDQLAVWDQLWHQNNNVWLRVHAFFFLERHMKKEAELKQMWPVIVGWQDRVDDWGLCDSLSKIYTRILELMPEEIYSKLQQWNIHDDLWKRRQSVVSLLYYSRTKKVYLGFDQILPLIDRLVSDKEYYVQKGVGWSLRELHNVYPAETLVYLEQNIKRLSGIAFSTAIEKIKQPNVDELKNLRKRGRQPVI